MNTTHNMDPCAEGTCFLPAEFVRLRYFFGQRLGVIELADEQSYHAGKQRLHNLRLHGSGVLCGLRAERYVYPQGSPSNQATTLLRVRRGAALDACGREIVVGFDQCIDVAAWFAQHPKARPVINPGAAPPASLKLWVALCYQECPSDPAPAPRDPCGCDAGGCEFARIREGFELKLLTDAEAQLLAPARPAADGFDLEGYLAGSLDSMTKVVSTLASVDCPNPPTDSCLLLASFDAALDSTGTKISDIKPPDNTISQRSSLLSTATLQELLIRVLAAGDDAGLLGSGPHFGAVTFKGNGGDSGTLSVEILLRDGTALAQDPVAESGPLELQVSQFDGSSWVLIEQPGKSYDNSTSHIEMNWTSGLTAGKYRLVIKNDLNQPVVDQKMRPLTPAVWARQFRLETKNNTLTLADSLFP